MRALLVLALLIVTQMRTTIGSIRDLPAVLTTEQAADLLGVGKDHLWALARAGSAPVQPLRLGRALRWPTAPLLALLGLDAKGGAATWSGSSDASPEDPSAQGIDPDGS